MPLGHALPPPHADRPHSAAEGQGVNVAPGLPARRHDLDALRVWTTLGVFLFHAARVFDSQTWHVKNDVFPLAADIFVTLLNLWQMPLMFLLAGASSFFALQVRSGREYVKERCQRLLVPFVWGVLLIIPPQVYIERIGTSPYRQSPLGFQGSFLEFYPHFFTQGVYPRGNLTWNHLWFVIYLFTFSLFLLPLFLYFRGDGLRWLEKVADKFHVGRAIIWLALPIFLIDVLLGPIFPGPQDFVHDLANVLRSLLHMLYGYAIMASHRLQAAVDRNGPFALTTALLATGVLGTLLLLFDWPPPGSLLFFVVRLAWALASWTWILTLLWCGRRYLNRERAYLRRASQIAYPFYIFHQTVIVIVAYFVVQWPSPVLVKFLAITGLSLPISWLLAEAVALTPVTRAMFGVKPARRPARPEARAA